VVLLQIVSLQIIRPRECHSIKPEEKFAVELLEIELKHMPATSDALAVCYSINKFEAGPNLIYSANLYVNKSRI